MKVESISLSDYVEILKHKGSVATLTQYIADFAREIPFSARSSILIIPGGGYDYCSPREGEPVALSFLSKGYNVFVLEYSTRNTSSAVFPLQLFEAMGALYYIKAHKEEMQGDGQVHVIGFSAGGHLAASLAFLANKPEFAEEFRGQHVDFTLASLLLGYPVISMNVATHINSFNNIASEKYSKAYLSLEQYVDKKAPPLFIFASSDDQSVSVANSLTLMAKYVENDLLFESHIYESAPHGFSLANKLVFPQEIAEKIQNNVSNWIIDAELFIKRHAK